jgi:putative redox protein
VQLSKTNIGTVAAVTHGEKGMSTASVKWVEGLQFVAESGSGHGIVVDASAEGGGYDRGARPMELVLMGLAGCTAMDVISILKKKRQPVTDLRVFANGEQAPTPPRYFTKIHLEYVAYGDVDPQALARAIELSKERYCSVSATLAGKAEITSSYRIENAWPEEQPVTA